MVSAMRTMPPIVDGLAREHTAGPPAPCLEFKCAKGAENHDSKCWSPEFAEGWDKRRHTGRPSQGDHERGTRVAGARTGGGGPPEKLRTRSFIDVHTHAFPRAWRAAWAKAHGGERESSYVAGADLPEWSPEGHLEVMDRCGIQTSILSLPPGASFLTGQAARDLSREINDTYAEIIQKYPTRFGAFANVPTDDMDAANAEMAYALDTLKLDGVTTTANINGVYLGEGAIRPVDGRDE